MLSLYFFISIFHLIDLSFEITYHMQVLMRSAFPVSSFSFVKCAFALVCFKQWKIEVCFYCIDYFSLLLLLPILICTFVCSYCVIVINGYRIHGVINLVEVCENVYSFGQLDES